MKKHITEIKRNWLGKEVERIEYDIEVETECEHSWIYKDEEHKRCDLCGQEYTLFGKEQKVDLYTGAYLSPFYTYYDWRRTK